MSLAELAIREAIGVVEDAGCDRLLTEAVILLDAAKDKVADFVDQEIEASRATSVKVVLNAIDGSLLVEIPPFTIQPAIVLFGDGVFSDTGINDLSGFRIYAGMDVVRAFPARPAQPTIESLAAQNDQPKDAQGAKG